MRGKGSDHSHTAITSDYQSSLLCIRASISTTILTEVHFQDVKHSDMVHKKLL